MRPRLTIFAAVLLSFAAASAVLASSTADFAPKDFAGTWTGHWENQTAHTSGDVTATVKSKHRKLTITMDLSGDPLQCGDPPPVSTTLRHGTGNNTWNAAGFKIRAPHSASFGDVTVVYRVKGKTLTAQATPPCHPDWLVLLHGHLRSSRLRTGIALSHDLGGDAGTLDADKD